MGLLPVWLKVPSVCKIEIILLQHKIDSSSLLVFCGSKQIICLAHSKEGTAIAWFDYWQPMFKPNLHFPFWNQVRKLSRLPLGPMWSVYKKISLSLCPNHKKLRPPASFFVYLCMCVVLGIEPWAITLSYIGSPLIFFYYFETRSHCVAQADLKLVILILQPPRLLRL